MKTHTQPPARLRSSLANMAWAVEERVVWSAGDAARGAIDAVKWPFERVAWAIEQRLLWPLQERLAGWDRPLRMVAATGLVLAAVAAGVGGLLWAAPDKGGNTAAVQSGATPVALTPEASHTSAPGSSTLQGAPPVFASPAAGAAAKVAGEEAVAVQPSDGVAKAGGGANASTVGAPGKPAGPAAIKVARKFSNAFVLYETGQSTAAVRTAFGETATPRLARSLLHRPPRLPANMKVPQAKVLNVVSGPSLGGVYSISVSLLRVGVTSELRLSMERAKDGKWQVTDALG
jgi:hypothetical protein